MREALQVINLFLILAAVVLAARYLWLMQHGYSLSLYRPD